MTHDQLATPALIFGYMFFRAVIPPMTRAVQRWEDRRLLRKKIHDAQSQPTSTNMASPTPPPGEAH